MPDRPPECPRRIQTILDNGCGAQDLTACGWGFKIKVCSSFTRLYDHSSSSHGRFPRMKRWLALVAVVLFAAAPVQAAGLTGHYLESRTCDVWTGPCFANAETSLGGKHAVLAWKVQEGALDNVRLDGLGVVAVIETSDTLGLDQTGPGKA